MSIVAKFGNQKTGTGSEHAQKLFDHVPFFETTPINATPSLEVKVCGGCGKTMWHLTKISTRIGIVSKAGTTDGIIATPCSRFVKFMKIPGHK